jgi:hypothetical protein
MADDRIKAIIVRVAGGAEHRYRGREAWALHHLVVAGERGCTPIDHPGPRWSDYVFKLRKRGLIVETVDERHAGTYAGSHARYVLRSEVEVVDREWAA